MTKLQEKQNIPQGWEETNLGSIADLYQPQTISKTQMSPDGKYLVFGANGIIGKHDRFNHEDSEVIVTCRGASCGSISMTPKQAWITGNAMVIKVDENKVIKPYIYYFLNNSDLNSVISGGAQPQITRQPISAYKILFPKSKTEQQKIAEILGTVDEDIAKTQEVIEATEKLKRGLSKQLFTRGINDGIEESMLGGISTITSSKRIMRSEYVEDGIPFYRSKEVIEKAKGIKHDSVFYISKERYEEIEQKFGAPHIGDILMTAVGTIGVVYLVNEEGFYFKDGNLLWIKDIKKSLDKSYLKYYMNSEIFQKRVLSTAIGSNQKALTIEKVEKVIVPIPKLPEQQKIAEILLAVDEKISVNKKLKAKLTLLKKGLMQDLLSGRVRTIIK